MAITLNGVNLEQPGKWWGFHLEAWPTTFGGWCRPENRAELIEAVTGYTYIAQESLGTFFHAGNHAGTANSLVGPNAAQKAGYAGYLPHDHHAFVRGAVTPNNAINYTLVDGATTYTARACSMRWGWAADGENRFAFNFDAIGVPVISPQLVIGDWNPGGTVDSLGFTIPSGLTNSALIVFGAWEMNQPYTAKWKLNSGPEYPMTAIAGSTVLNTGGAGRGIMAFYLLNPAAGDGATIVLDSAAGGCWRGWAVLSNVDQSSPVYAVGTNIGTSAASSVSVSAPVGTIAFNAVFNGAVSTEEPTPVAGQTELGVLAFNAWAAGIGYGDSTPEWTFGGSRIWAACAVAINGG